MEEKSTLLIVDDTPHNLDVMVNLLSEKYRVKVALNGEKALKIAHSSTKPDLILLDIMMPGIDGFEVCRQLKSEDSTKDIPIIFVTAMHEIGDEEKGLALGAVDYITKPVSPPIVLARVKSHLKLSNQQKALSEEVKERTQELHLKNMKLEEELMTRTILERKLSFQLEVQHCASEFSQVQLKSQDSEKVYDIISTGLFKALSMERLAIYKKGRTGWAILSEQPEGAPALTDDDLTSEGWIREGEWMNFLSDEDDVEPIVIWIKLGRLPVELVDWEESMVMLVNNAKSVLNSSKLRDSISEMSLF